MYIQKFKPSYYRDVKIIKSFLINKSDKLTNCDILKFLDSIKLYNENKQLVSEYKHKLANEYNLNIKDDNSNLNEIENLLNLTNEIISFFYPKPVSENFFKKIYDNTIINNYFAKFSEYISNEDNINKLLSKHYKKLFIDALPNVELNKVIKKLENTKSIASQFFNYYSDLTKDIYSIKSCLLNKNSSISIDEIINYTNYLFEYNYKQSWLNNNKEIMIQSYGVNFDQNLSNWSDLGKKLDNVKKLFSFFSPSPIPEVFIKKLFDCDRNKILILRENLSKVFYEKDHIIELYSKHFNSDLLCFEQNTNINESIENLKKIVANVEIIVEQLDEVYKIRKNINNINISQIISELEMMIKIKDFENELSSNEIDYSKQFGPYYHGTDTEWNIVDEVLSVIDKLIHFKSITFFNKIDLFNAICSSDSFLIFTDVKNEIDKLIKNIDKEFKLICSWFRSKPFEIQTRDLNGVINWLDECLNNITGLEDLIELNDIIQECRNSGIGDFVDTVISNKIEPINLKNSFLKQIYNT